MVCYNGLVLPLQWKSTHRSQASKQDCLCFDKVLFMDTTTWTRPLHPLLKWLMTRLMLAVFLNSIVHFICLLFCSEMESLTELTGSARLLASEPQGGSSGFCLHNTRITGLSMYCHIWHFPWVLGVPTQLILRVWQAFSWLSDLISPSLFHIPYVSWKMFSI